MCHYTLNLIDINTLFLVQVSKKTGSDETVVNSLTAGSSFGVGYLIVSMTILR